MDYFFEILKALVLIVMSYLIVIKMPYIAKYAIPITLITIIFMGLSLLHSEKVTTYADGIVGSSAILNPSQAKAFCGEVDLSNTFCYKEVVYVGYPFRAIAIEYPLEGEPKLQSGRWGTFYNFLIYLTISIVIAYGIEKLRRSVGSKDGR